MFNLLVSTRNHIIEFFTKQIILIVRNNKIINKPLFVLVLSLLLKYDKQYEIVLKRLCINYLYNKDGIYFYENYTKRKLRISHIILDAEITYTGTTKKNINNIVKKYDLHVPLFVFLHNEKLMHYDYIIFKLLVLAKVVEKEININDNLYLTFEELIV